MTSSPEGRGLLREHAPIDRTLDDGLAVRLRPIVKTDLERVRRAYELLSEESRMNRFWEKPAEMSSSRAESLTNTDDSDHIAWIALRPDSDEFPGYAGGSFWRDHNNPERAELGFTVADDWQRQGLATLLFSILWVEAWHSGVRQFHGSCRLKNVAMAEWWHGMGGSVHSADRHHQLSLDLVPPESFVNNVTYGMPTSYRSVELAQWMREWIEMTE